MKMSTFAAVALSSAAGAGAMILNSAASAAYTGLQLEKADLFFSNHPNQVIRDAWNAGPVNQFDIWRLYATFNSNTSADRVNAVASNAQSPLEIHAHHTSFHNYTELDPHEGTLLHFNIAYTGSNIVERCWDSYVTIGNALNGGLTAFAPGFEKETHNFGYQVSDIESTSAAWFITPNQSQGQAVASAPGQPTSPMGTYRVLLAQIVINEVDGPTMVSGTAVINAGGTNYVNQSFYSHTLSGQPFAPVAGDVNGNYIVNVDDLLAVLSGWGACSGPPCASWCPGDVHPPTIGDCVVDVDDLLTVINNWSFGNGACCLNDTCIIGTVSSCNLQGGEFLGTGTPCTPNPCD